MIKKKIILSIIIIQTMIHFLRGNKNFHIERKKDEIFSR
jgi:hypothetical protein